MILTEQQQGIWDRLKTLGGAQDDDGMVILSFSRKMSRECRELLREITTVDPSWHRLMAWLCSLFEGCTMRENSEQVEYWLYENPSRESILRRVRKDGFALRSVPSEFRDDKEVVMTAIDQHRSYPTYGIFSSVVRYASKRLRDHLEVATHSVKHDPYSLIELSSRLRGHPSLVMDVIRVDEDRKWSASRELRAQWDGL